MFEIAPLTRGFEQAAALLNASLGARSYSLAHVAELGADPSYHLLAARADDGSLAGVAGARLIDAAGLAFYDAFGDGARVLAGKRLGALSTSAVAPAIRGRGVGTALARARLAWLVDRGCSYAVGVAWESGLAHTSRPVFRKLGFAALGRSEVLFTRLSEQQDFDCPVCGHPCRCAAILFGRAL